MSSNYSRPRGVHSITWTVVLVQILCVGFLTLPTDLAIQTMDGQIADRSDWCGFPLRFWQFTTITGPTEWSISEFSLWKLLINIAVLIPVIAITAIHAEKWVRDAGGSIRGTLALLLAIVSTTASFLAIRVTIPVNIVFAFRELNFIIMEMATMFLMVAFGLAWYVVFAGLGNRWFQTKPTGS